MTLKVAILGAGVMGSAVAARLVRHGVEVTTWLDGRSDATVARAAAAGMKRVALSDVAAADLVFSIVPPSEAIAIAQSVKPCLDGAERKPVWVDFNAVNPQTVSRIAGIVEATGARCVGGAIIGVPARPEEIGPTFYVAGPAADSCLVLGERGLRLRMIDGPVEAAAALKMSYAGITKGLAAIASMMILVAEREGAGQALYAELADSQPQLLARFKKTLPDMYPKAYRWVAEMRELAEFVGDQEPAYGAYLAFASQYERLSDRMLGAPRNVSVIERFLKTSI